MKINWKGSLVSALLLAAPVWADGTPNTAADLSTKEALARTPEQSKPLGEQIQTLNKTVNQLEEKVDHLKLRELIEPETGPNDHPMWP